MIVDDGSTDKTLEVIEEIKYSNPKIRIEIYKQKNKGVSVARNNALQYVDGIYTIFIDPDDYLDESMLKKCMKR
ncbi:glycosyltransferase family 2 protein [Sporosarcina sp. G11-34]|uniref:glycosyltransferase family 2 protein n=1 Tax=Sporosarcina sp. G11-34 TaxID=2849605 RepID=UPI003FA7CDE5